MTRLIFETRRKGFVAEFCWRLVRYEVRVGGEVVAGRQVRPVRLLFATLALFALFALISVSPPQPFPASMVGQPDQYAHVIPAPLPAVPSAAGLVFSAYEVGQKETLARIAYAARVSVACLEALNPGVDVVAGVNLRLPRAGSEVVVFTASGGESLSDLADFWGESRVAGRLNLSTTVITESKPLLRTKDYSAYLSSGSPLRPVTLERLVQDNAIPAGRPLYAGQTVFIQLTRPPNEVHVKLADGSWLYYGANMSLPVAGVLSQSYGGSSGQHKGMDIAAPLNSPITTPRSGVVFFVGVDESESAMGNHVHLIHEFSPEALAYMADRFGVDDYASLSDGAPDENGMDTEPNERRECLAYLQAMRDKRVRVSMLETVYGHVGGSAFGVSEGSIVVAGSRLARVGNNGNSTGSHVHWMVLVGEQAVPPMWFVAGMTGQ